MTHPAHHQKTDQPPPEIIDRIDDIAVLRLPIPEFENLPLQEKVFLYHLWNAAIAGDRITYRQHSRRGMDITAFLLKIIAHEDLLKKIYPEIYPKILEYAKKLCINHGNHDFWSGVKFLPKFTRQELEEVLAVIAEHAPRLQEADYKKQYDDIIFNPAFEPMMTQKNPKTGDIITESCNTYYDGVTLKDLEGFKDQNPNNSTVTMQHGRIVEKIWRCGNDRATAGLYAKELAAVVLHLRAALPYAAPEQTKSLKLLIQYFEEGTAKLCDDYNIAWLHTNPVADMILGFIEEYRDARGMKGLFEAVVYYRDEHATQTITALASLAQSLEDTAPWDNAYKKKWNTIPVANAIVQLIGTGGAGPYSWAGVNLPNAQWIRDKHGSKNIIITNVLYASRSALFKRIMHEFVASADDRALLEQHMATRELLSVGLHEVVGHGAGTASKSLAGDPRDHLREHYSTLEEARAELCMLWHIWNPLLIEKGIMQSRDVAKSEYLAYTLRDLLIMRTFVGEDEIHEDHHRATHLIISYLREKGVVEFYVQDKKTYPRIIDYEKMHEHVGVLLAELQRIKSEGDYAAIKALVEKYAIYFDLKLRDEIVARSRAINYPATIAYLMPIPRAVKNDAGEITDIRLRYPQGIIEQAQAWNNPD